MQLSLWLTLRDPKTRDPPKAVNMAPRGKRLRLGYGEFAPPGELSRSTWDARRIFLEEIEDLAPEVLRALREEVFPHFEPPIEWVVDNSLSPADRSAEVNRQLLYLIRGEQPPAPSNWLLRWVTKLLRLIRGRAEQAVYRRAEQDPVLKDRLVTWATKFRICEDWVLKSALGTLRFWSLGASSLIWIHPASLQSSALTDDERRFAFEHPGWYPELLTQEQAEANIRLVFDASLRLYFERIEALAKDRGLKRTPAKRSRSGQSARRHFEWLVRWQVQGWTQRSIADEADLEDTKTVAAGIKAAADAIGLTRRSK